MAFKHVVEKAPRPEPSSSRGATWFEGLGRPVQLSSQSLTVPSGLGQNVPDRVLGLERRKHV